MLPSQGNEATPYRRTKTKTKTMIIFVFVCAQKLRLIRIYENETLKKGKNGYLVSINGPKKGFFENVNNWFFSFGHGKNWFFPCPRKKKPIVSVFGVPISHIFTKTETHFLIKSVFVALIRSGLTKYFSATKFLLFFYSNKKFQKYK